MDTAKPRRPWTTLVVPSIGVKQPASRSIPAVDAGLPRSAEHRQAGLR
jgi:hypothetical protein